MSGYFIAAAICIVFYGCYKLICLIYKGVIIALEKILDKTISVKQDEPIDWYSADSLYAALKEFKILEYCKGKTLDRYRIIGTHLQDDGYRKVAEDIARLQPGTHFWIRRSRLRKFGEYNPYEHTWDHLVKPPRSKGGEQHEDNTG